MCWGALFLSNIIRAFTLAFATASAEGFAIVVNVYGERASMGFFCRVLLALRAQIRLFHHPLPAQTGPIPDSIDSGLVSVRLQTRQRRSIRIP